MIKHWFLFSVWWQINDSKRFRIEKDGFTRIFINIDETFNWSYTNQFHKRSFKASKRFSFVNKDLSHYIYRIAAFTGAASKKQAF